MEEAKGAYLEAKRVYQETLDAWQEATKRQTQARKTLIDALKQEAFEEWKREQDLSNITLIEEGDVRKSLESRGLAPHVVKVTFKNEVQAQWHPFGHTSGLVVFMVEEEKYGFNVHNNQWCNHSKKRRRKDVNDVLDDTQKLHLAYTHLTSKRQHQEMYPEVYIKEKK